MSAIMIMGTGSGAGKSLISAGLCRALSRRGLIVRPFKPQNMSNNAAVTADGGEIGRAQALQAMAANVEPSIHMNPVLLKPQSDVGAQVVVHGHAIGSASAQDYLSLKPRLMAAVMESFTQLSQQADIIIVEGAGSPAEINLRQHDIANMGFARQANIPAILVGDVDRGGVIAAMAGTASLLDTSDRQLLKGFVINRFRGDQSLFEPALSMIQKHTGMQPLGIIPFFPDAHLLPAEDAADLTATPAKTAESFRGEKGAEKEDILIAVPMLPHISNFDDMDPLRLENGVHVRFVPPGEALPACDLIVLPGSKAVISDLAVCRRMGWDIDIFAHVRRGGGVVGLCGGFQMLGRNLCDPHAVEGSLTQATGFNLLNVHSVIAPSGKTLQRVHGVDALAGCPVAGYEIHAGRTSGPDMGTPMLRINGTNHGAVSPDGKVRGCYLHGLFSMDEYRHNFLKQIRHDHARHSNSGYLHGINQTLDMLADLMEESLDMDRVLEIAKGHPDA